MDERADRRDRLSPAVDRVEVSKGKRGQRLVPERRIHIHWAEVREEQGVVQVGRSVEYGSLLTFSVASRSRFRGRERE